MTEEKQVAQQPRSEGPSDDADAQSSASLHSGNHSVEENEAKAFFPQKYCFQFQAYIVN